MKTPANTHPGYSHDTSQQKISHQTQSYQHNQT